MQKYISAGERAGSVRVVIVTLDNHLAGTVARAEETLRHEIPGLSLRLHAVSGWEADPAGRERCLADIASADIIIATMLFMEDHIHSVLPALTARRDDCDAIVCCMSAGEVIKLTRLGQFRMDKPEGGVVSLLKRLRGNSSKAGADKPASGARQMEMLKRLPKILRFIPGTAQDVRAYFLTLQYWLAGSELNIANLVRFLVGRYGAGPRAGLKDKLSAALPAEYPEIGVYHPGLAGGIASRRSELPAGPANAKGTVGVLVMRSYLLARNTAHYDGVIRAFEAQGLRVVPAFASGLDARPAIETFFMDGGKPSIDALVSLTGFSLVGGPAYNDKDAAARILGALDVPYIAAQAVEFQSLDEWENSDRGLTPVETTMMIAIPELDGATSPTLFGGRSESASGKGAADMTCHDERAEALARRVAHQISLRVKSRAERKIGIVLFNFPPNAGSTGTAAFLSVYASLFNTLKALAAAGYQVDVPSSPDALRERILGGNAARFGTPANVVARIPADDHVRRERHLSEIEAQWGPAPGRIQTDGRTILVLGERFGNVLVGVQPGFGYEGDPMRLLFEKGFAPTHAFSAFYRYLREDFAADAVLHFGTHGALEFMPGKQTALSDACWPERLIGSMPNIYLYAANNPSEGTIAKRRSAATLVSYLTPPVGHAGLYRGLLDLKSSLERWRGAPPEASDERARLAVTIQADAAALELASAEPAWGDATAAAIAKLTADVLELEYTLIPDGLHIVGEAATAEQRSRSSAGHVGRNDAGSEHHQRPPRHRRDRGGRITGRGPGHSRPQGRRRRHRRVDAARGKRPAARCRSRTRRHRPRPRWPLRATRTQRRSHSQRVDPADWPQSAWLRSVPHPERIRGARRRPASRSHPATPQGRHRRRARDHRARSVGNRQPEVRGRPDRPGAGADGRAAPLRQLWPPVRRGAHSAGRAGPAAHRCDDDAVGHLPRSPGAADQAPRRGGIPRRQRRRAARPEFHSPACAGLSGTPRHRSRNSGAARLLQRQQRLWLQRQSPDRERLVAGRGRTRRDLLEAQMLRLWPLRRTRRPIRHC